eukprot:7834961-Alexandrium_andersonii.AAC.1
MAATTRVRCTSAWANARARAPFWMLRVLRISLSCPMWPGGLRSLPGHHLGYFGCSGYFPRAPCGLG